MVDVDGTSVAVPPGEVWVLGDAADRSTADSRELGSIPVETIEGKVVFRYWPIPTRIGSATA